MGHTHYFDVLERPTADEWDTFRMGVDYLISTTNVDLDNNSSYDVVHINGVGDDSAETLIMTPTFLGRAFCKTYQRDYDEVITAILIWAKVCFQDKITISSDGIWDEWFNGRLLFKETFTYDPHCPFDK